MTVTGNNSLALAFQQLLSYGIGQSQNLPIPMIFRSIFKASGGLLDQCDAVYSATLTFVASTPQVIDLKSLVDAQGNAIAFDRIRVFAIRVNSQTDGDVLLVGDNGANDWLGLTPAAATAAINVYPSTGANDGFVIFQMPNSTGAAVGSTTHLVKLNPGSNAFTVDLLIAGCLE